MKGFSAVGRGSVAGATDESLVAGMASGDREATSALIRRYQARVFGVACAVLGDRGRAEEVAQEAFVKAWRNAASFDPRRASVATWLAAITRNLAIDRVRAERIRPQAIDIEISLVTTPGSGPGPEDVVTRGSEAARVVAALRRLPEEQRRALFLASFGGHTTTEVAEREGIPLGTAKTRIRAALLRLRDELAGEVA